MMPAAGLSETFGGVDHGIAALAAKAVLHGRQPAQSHDRALAAKSLQLAGGEKVPPGIGDVDELVAGNSDGDRLLRFCWAHSPMRHCAPVSSGE